MKLIFNICIYLTISYLRVYLSKKSSYDRMFTVHAHAHARTRARTHTENIYIYIYERSDTKSNVELDGFRSRLQASYVSNYTEEF